MAIVKLCCCCLHIKSRSDLYSVLSNIRTGPTDANAFQQYFGEIKNKLVSKNEAQNFTFRTTSPIWLGDGSGESSYPYNYVKEKIKTLRCFNQELQWFNKKWSVKLPGIDLSHEKNAIFAVTGSGVGQ